jgi:hypothetical protein
MTVFAVHIICVVPSIMSQSYPPDNSAAYTLGDPDTMLLMYMFAPEYDCGHPSTVELHGLPSKLDSSISHDQNSRMISMLQSDSTSLIGDYSEGYIEYSLTQFTDSAMTKEETLTAQIKFDLSVNPCQVTDF